MSSVPGDPRRVRCRSCGRLTRTDYPCKMCGGIKHIDAQVTILLSHPLVAKKTMAEVLEHGRRKCAAVWRRRAGRSLSFDRVSLLYEFDTADPDRQTMTVTMWERR